MTILAYRNNPAMLASYIAMNGYTGVFVDRTCYENGRTYYRVSCRVGNGSIHSPYEGDFRLRRDAVAHAKLCAQVSGLPYLKSID